MARHGLERAPRFSVQREANGIPGGLVENTELSRGCWNHSNLYWDKNGQFPHDEVPGQPGYTELGDRAAQNSNLGGGRGWWSATTNPWSHAPMHLYDLLAPAVGSAWYGESKRVFGRRQRVCMGTGAPWREGPDTFTVYSYPGDGATGVIPNYLAGELPFAPGQAVGIPAGTVTGPYILLFPACGNGSSELQSATLAGPDGPVMVKVVGPDTAAPADRPAGWEHYDTVDSGPFVIPTAPLKPLTQYTLMTNWLWDEDAKAHTETMRFTTGPRVRHPYCPPDVCLRGRLALRTTRRQVKVTLDPAVGQRLEVEMRRGKRMCAKRRRGHCPKQDRWFLGYTSVVRTVRARTPSVTIKLPPRTRGLNALWVSVSIDGRFTARSRQWLGAQITATDFNTR